MFDAIIAFSLRQRGLVLLLTLLLVAGGILSFSRLPIDAVPDITNNQVQILTVANALSSPEVERYVTFPIEIAVKSLPDIVELRSLSRPGLSVVTVVFNDGVDTYFARQQVLEKLREAEEAMPEGVERPELAPVSTGLGEIFRYVIRDTTGRLSPMDLRTVQDWIVRRQLLGTPGIAEVNSLGGYVRQYHVLVNPEKLLSYNLTLRDVLDAVSRTSGNAGGAYIETGPEQLSVRSVGLATSIEDIGNTVVKTTSTGTPVLVGDVATVEIGAALRFGSASQDGQGEVVTGITMQLKGANARLTVNAVKQRVEEIRPSLPAGVVIEPYYDREVLVDNTISTVLTNLIEGALLVIGVLLLFLVNLRAGIVLASVIPLSMMFAGILMLLTGQTGNLMSLGAIDFGLVVDGSLIIAENVLRILDERLRKSGGVPLTDRDMKRLVYGASVEVRKAAQFGEIIIIVVYLPILTLQGIEGKLFRPMALTVVYALIGALILSVTYVPAILSLVLKSSRHIRHSPVIEFLKKHYTSLLARALRHRIPILGTTAVLFVASVIAFSNLGGEFIPRLDEGDIAMHIIRLPSVSLSESQKITTRVERALMKFPEVRTVVSSTGRAEISTDPMGPELSDAFIMLKPRDEWTSGRSKEELIVAMGEALEKIPGAGVQFLQPIEMRTNELIAGARGDVVLKVIGQNFDTLNSVASSIARIVRNTPGSADVAMEQTSGLPQLIIRPDRSAIARYGMTVQDVNDIVGTAVGGTYAGEVAEGEQRFDIVVRLPDTVRSDVGALRALTVITPAGERVTLSALADISIEEGPVQISRENGYRFVSVQSNVRGRDVQSFVEDVREQIQQEIVLPTGYNISYGGQFENLAAASQRLMIVVPAALLLIFLLLFQTFRSVRLGIMIFLCVPMAVIGGVGALLIGGLPFSISAGVGFIALFGIAVLNGIVMVAAIRKFQAGGLDRRASVNAGAVERLRPVITTAALAGFGFVPMLLAQGSGAEVQRPLATVIIGGLVSSTLLTLFVLPIIYDWFGGSYVPISNDEREEFRESAEAEQSLPDRAGGASNVTGTVVTVLFLLILSTVSLSAQTVLTREAVRERAAVAPEVAEGLAELSRQQALRGSGAILPPLRLYITADDASSAALSGTPSMAIGFEQSFGWPGLYAERRALGDILVTRANASQTLILRRLQHNAISVWLKAATARRLIDIADSAVALSSEFLRIATRRWELGETTVLESAQATLVVSKARRLANSARGDYRAEILRLRTLLGIPGSEEITVPPLDTAIRPILPLQQLETLLASRHPALRLAQLTVDAARANESVVEMERLPDFSIGYSLQSVGGVGGFYGAEVGVSLPIWRWTNSAPDQAARAETGLREAERNTLAVAILADIREAYARYETALVMIAELQSESVPRSLQAYSMSIILFQAGEANYVEVLAAATSGIEAQRELSQAFGDLALARLEIEFLTGGDL